MAFYFSLSSGFGCEREATIATRAKIRANVTLTQDLWGVVCIGYYTKFFVLRHGQQTLQPYNGDVRWESNVHFNDIATILSNIQREIRVQSRSAQ
ncbi:hypothetical protein N7471_007244 [Penicillium samsonianum]|uniref:uncharacterized protein n=1 Tax=Penicillium samsonianum TaxID=1882272 RepID=UPI002548EF6F|nr:uncharacterized protein N7471_007244 [Penicillium samsonianum]KAJ6132029.1 hypothetical protein N7471_007244 [Penicillium samsonianum]